MQTEHELRELMPSAGALTRRNDTAMRCRLGQLALMMALVVAVLHPARALVLFGFPHPVWLSNVLPLTAAGVSLDVATYLATRRENLRDDDVLRWGIVYYALRPAMLTLLPTRLPTLLGFDAPTLTIAHGFLLLFALFLPLDSGKAWKAASVAIVLQLGATIAVSAIAPSPQLVVRMAATSAVMLFLTWICTRFVASAAGARDHGVSGSGYRIERAIRREAYGTLWLARHRLLARPAGVRTVRLRDWRRLALPPLQELEVFARAAASLRSPHSVTLYDYGTTVDGCLYSASEFLDGEDLGSYVKRVGPLPLQEALTYAFQLCDSLVEAHASRLVHHGVVPSNIVLSRLGRTRRAARLVKFDVANIEYRLDLSSRTPRADRHWDPPELVARTRCGKPADIYQLGLLLEFMLRGEPPGEAQRTARAEDVPEPIQDLIAWCTRTNPFERPRAALLRDQLEYALSTLCGWKPRMRALDALAVSPSGEARPTSEGQPLDVSRLSLLRRLTKGSTKPALSGVQGALPAVGVDIREAARERLGHVAIADVVITMTLTSLSRFGVEGNIPAVRRETGLIVLTVLSMDLCLWLIAKLRKYSTDFAFDAGIFFFIARGAISAVATIHGFTRMGVDPPIMTFAPLMVLVLPLFVPKSPSALALPTLVCAAIEPLAQGFMVPSDFTPVWGTSLLTACTVFVWSQLLAAVLYGSRKIASEREVFGAYRRGKLLGQGGNGEVWRAKHDVLERDAALKVLRMDELHTGEQRAWLERFKHEAQVTSQLTSPYTVKVYDYGINETGIAYSVMELLEGEDLKSYVDRAGALQADEAIALALQICDSLGEAHERGLVHRDVKPANVFLVNAAGRVQVKVLDFGLADYAERLADSGHTTARLAGTPAFMPPEAFLGKPIDARSDIYELGCMLYYALSGRNLFERPSMAAMALAHVHHEPEPLSAHSRHPLPHSLEAVISRCVQKPPEARFQSVDELEAALIAVQDEEDARVSGNGYERTPRPEYGADAHGV